MPGEEFTSISNGNMNLKVAKDLATRLTNTTLVTEDGALDVPGYCDLRPEDCTDDPDSETIISIKVR